MLVSAGGSVNPLLQVSGLGKSFPLPKRHPFAQRRSVRILDDVGFSVAAGETLSLVGESGSGKSTTARIVTRLLPADTGSVRFAGREILAMTERRFRPHRGGLQMVFQHAGRSLNPSYTVGRTLDEMLRVHRPELGRAERLDAQAAQLEQVGLDPSAASRFPHEFSGGQKQRIGIARALLSRPELLVADEPVSALDVSVQAQILELLCEVRDRAGLALLFIAHDLAVVRRMSDRVAVMYRGRIVETAPGADFHRRAAHPYTRLLLDAVPRLAAPAPTAEMPIADTDAPPPSEGCAFAPRCALRIKRCDTERPALRPVGAGREAACHLAG